MKHPSPFRKLAWIVVAIATTGYLGLIAWTDNRIHGHVGANTEVAP